MPTINVQPSVLDLALYAGDGIEFRLICTDSADAPVDITGIVKAQIRTTRTNYDEPLVEFAVNLTDAYLGVIVLALTGEQTHDLVEHFFTSPGVFNGVWDIGWEPEGTYPRTLCQGKVECVADVSR